MATLTDSAPTLVNELNLAHYLELLRRRWLLPVVLALLGAAAMFLYSGTLPVRYSARADVAVVRTGTLVNFDPKLRTISDTDPNALALDQVTRRRSLVVIGQSLALAQQVVTALGASLPEELDTAQNLRNAINVDSDGDLIRIQMFSDSPDLAARVVNTYADAYVARVNQVFSESPVSPVAFQVQADQAKQTYQTKQTALETFISTNPMENLRRQQDLIQRQLNAQLEVESKLARLQADAQSLRALIESSQGDASTGEELAKLILQANAYNNTGDLPVRLDLTFAELERETTREKQIAQLDALLKAIQTRRAAYGGAAVQEQYRQLNEIQVQIERAAAQQKELQTDRDSAWSVYQLLLTKVTETSLASTTENQTVRVANMAVPPTQPTESRRLLTVLLGGMMGLVLGAGAALVIRTK